MALSNKRKLIIEFCLANSNEITKGQAFSVIGHTYYYNGDKHTGDVLSRMVKAGILERVKKGNYKLCRRKAGETGAIIPENQKSLFD
jgi:hypothetical protein